MNRKNEGFTLVEILIVVIILGILAAIVIPQFTEASNDARESALTSDLQTLRSQIELYKIQHNDMAPGYKRVGGVVGSFVAADFVTQLTTKTDVDGASGSDYGPYLQAFPSNPFVSGANSDAVTTTLNEAGYGWYFDTTNLKASPNDADHDHL